MLSAENANSGSWTPTTRNPKRPYACCHESASRSSLSESGSVSDHTTSTTTWPPSEPLASVSAASGRAGTALETGTDSRGGRSRANASQAAIGATASSTARARRERGITPAV